MDYLFTQQLMYSTVGSHVAHPAKGKFNTFYYYYLKGILGLGIVKILNPIFFLQRVICEKNRYIICSRGYIILFLL